MDRKPFNGIQKSTRFVASDRPLVSVVIPTYNRGPLLKTAISSALRQERAGDLFDVEVIVVDDCPPEDMSPISAAFPDVYYIRLPENREASGARNAGIKQARGKYVALLDDDDEFLTHKTHGPGPAPRGESRGGRGVWTKCRDRQRPTPLIVAGVGTFGSGV